MSEIKNNPRKSNVSASWEDSGWNQDGFSVFKKEEQEPEPETADAGDSDTDTDNTQTATT